MSTNQFESSRSSEGTLRGGAQHNGSAPNESSAISRDDVRDGFADPPSSREGSLTTTAQARMYRVLAAGTLVGNHVRNPAGDDLGSIEEIMLDLERGRIAYAVLSFGGFLGIGDKLFAIPWSALRIDRGEHEFTLDMNREALDNAPGFDKHHWPDMADPVFGRKVHKHYGRTPYWEGTVETPDF
jgi:sporulation protein YlmC with PRC-barrel domain